MGMDSVDEMKEYAKRRVNLFFSSVIFLAFLGVLMEESGDLSDIIDDGGLVLLAIIVIAVIAMRRKKGSAAELKSTNNMVGWLALIMVLLTFYGIYNELGDSAAFGDDIAQLIVTVAFLINRYV
jgi:nicotinamide riboside transporter PnuC